LEKKQLTYKMPAKQNSMPLAKMLIIYADN
jgi:hypothetical protein